MSEPSTRVRAKTPCDLGAAPSKVALQYRIPDGCALEQGHVAQGHYQGSEAHHPPAVEHALRAPQGVTPSVRLFQLISLSGQPQVSHGDTEAQSVYSILLRVPAPLCHISIFRSALWRGRQGLGVTQQEK